MVTATIRSCALCDSPATITDWTPIHDWLTVEGCSCGGFFVWTGVWDWRLHAMPEPERQRLAARVRSWRASGREAWIATPDGQLMGRIGIFLERPVLGIAPSRFLPPDTSLPPTPPKSRYAGGSGSVQHWPGGASWPGSGPPQSGGRPSERPPEPPGPRPGSAGPPASPRGG